jgi:pimeloyl-ACP methyl ester carboxylesterase
MAEVTLSDGATIWYEKSGSGKPLLHIHGSAFGHKNFARLSPLMTSDFEVIDFDLPGYGDSHGGPPATTFEATAAQVAEFIGALGYEKVHLHGTSFGAMIGLTLAAKHPRTVDKVVLSCFLARYDEAARMMRATWKRAARESGMEAVADLTSVAGFARAFYENDWAASQLQSMRDAFSRTKVDAFVASTEMIERTDLSSYISRVWAPTLLLAGSEDNMTPFKPASSGVGMSSMVSSMEWSQKVILENCGHYLVIEQPDQAAEHIIKFLKR